MDNNILGVRKIESPDELIYMPLGSKIKVIWHKSDCYEEGEECFRDDNGLRNLDKKCGYYDI